MTVSPQAENGHTDIANVIVEKFCSYRISGEEWMVLWFILRKTYGWHKKEDLISLSQFAVGTGLKRQTVLRAISKLASKKIIAVIKNDDSQINLYRFNKDFDQWSPLSKKITVSSKKIMAVTNKDNRVSSIKGHTKENSTKEIITKTNIYIVEIISYLNEKTGKRFKTKSKETKSRICARLKDGFKIEDFKQVIDNKCSQWLNDPKMSAFLRPETLFGTKFESYLNEIPTDPVLSQFSDKTQRTIRNLQNWSPPDAE